MSSPHLPSRKLERENGWDAYTLVGIATLAASVLISTLPQGVGAFWPFSFARAESAGEPPVLHDSELPLLSAALHVDPNPDKGAIDLPLSEDSALMASAGPAGTLPASTGIGGGAGSISLYEVREGDSLGAIADMFDVSVNTILWANDIKDAKTIQPGDTLLILPVSGVKHTVKSGETLAGIAKKYEADLDEVALFNGIGVGDSLASGQELIIPGGNLAAPVKKAVAKGAGSTSAKATPTLTGYFANPVPGSRLTQGVHGYNGVDLGAPQGTPVYASAAGSVIVAKSGGGYNGGYGNYIVIAHDNGTQTLYAHLSSVGVSVGEVVGKGDKIGGVGNTGRSTGFHLHFEVRGARNPFAQ